MKQNLNNGFVFPTWEIHVKAFQPTPGMWACIDVYHILNNMLIIPTSLFINMKY